MRGRRISPTVVALVLWGAGIPVWAHGVTLDVAATQGVEVQARYDTGEPMNGASVTVFAPRDPATPWITGQTDAQGRFWFRPDPAQVGSWQVRIRQAGHGGMVTIPVEAPPALAATLDPTAGGSADPGLLPPSPEASHVPITGIPNRPPGLQVAMAATWVWGLVGTALFFIRITRKPPHASS